MAPAQTDYAKAVWQPSPNYWQGRAGYPITAIVIHGTAGGGAVSWFATQQSQVSAHYVVSRQGVVTQCVREDDRAWHAGITTDTSVFAGAGNQNNTSIGIETERDQANTSPVVGAQVQALQELVADIQTRRGPLMVIRHDDIDVGRVCPGPGYPMAAVEGASDVLLSGWPFMNQLTAPTGDGFPSENAADDCGETCCAMILKWALNKDVTPDAIKDILYGQGTTGYSYISDLSNYLNTQGLTTRWAEADSAATAERLIRGFLAKGWPTIALMYADRANRQGGHFCVCIGEHADASKVLANPWIGTAETLTPAQWMRWYAGYYLSVEATKYVAPPPAPPQNQAGNQTPTYHLTAAQWLQLSAKPNNAVPGAPQVPKGAAIVCIGNPVVVTDGAGNKSKWQRIGWAYKGKLIEGFVLSRFVKAV